jgi:hypothetical protein
MESDDEKMSKRNAHKRRNMSPENVPAPAKPSAAPLFDTDFVLCPPENEPALDGCAETSSSHPQTPQSAGLEYTGSPTQPGQMGWKPQIHQRRGSDDDGYRPEKRLKPGPGDEFTDSKMPDIFRFAHPSI